MVTLKDIKQLWETWSTSHPQLESYGFDNVNNLSTDNRAFPCMWVMPTATNLQSLTFEVYFADILLEDRTNIVDLLSDMLTIGYDFTTYLEQNQELDVEINGIDPFDGKFDDYLGGWIYTITVEYINPKSCS